MSQKCHSILTNARGRRLADVGSVSVDLPDGHTIPEHSHPEDQILFASAGVMTLRTPQGVWVLPPHRALWIPARTLHSVRASGRVAMRTLYLYPRLCRSLPRRCFVMHVSGLLKELILHACALKSLRPAVAAERRITDLLIDQLQVAESIPLQLPHPRDARACRVMDALVANPDDARTLEALCRESGASKRTIQRLFLDETRITFRKWRQQLRLLHAMQRLASGEKVITAALDSGYTSTSAFISMFRKQLGTTPARYLAADVAGPRPS